MTKESHFEKFTDGTGSTQSDLPQYITNNSDKSIVSYVEEKLKQTNKVGQFVTYRGEVQVEVESSDTSTNNPTNPYIRKLKTRFNHFTNEQWTVLAVMCYVFFSTYTCENMLATFFSTEILRKGGNQFHVGLIFGIYPISKCLLCPLFTYLLNKMSCKTMLVGGFATFSLGTLALSQTERLMSTDIFLVICVLLRIVQAIGNSATYVASVFLVSCQWKYELIFALGAAESFTGMAMLIGPPLGAVLFQEGGFELPFYASFFINVVGVIICYSKLQSSENKTSPANFLHLLRIPNVIVTVVFMCFIIACDDLVNSVLQVYMTTELNSSPVTIGCMFVICACSYLFMVVVVGLFIKKRFAERLTMICGGMLVVIGYLLIAPTSIFSSLGWTNPTVLSISISMFIMGLGFGAGLVPNYNDIRRSVINYGMEDNETTDSLVGALFNSATFLGEFLAPILGGSMMEGMGNFKTVSSTLAVMIASVVGITAICYLVDGIKSSREQ